MGKVEQVLARFGLEEQEIKTYLALLQLGEATATKLAERTGLGRVHMYQITNRLIEKGLASYIIKNNIRYFIAADPEIFLTNLHEKEEQFKNVLPELKQRQQTIKFETKVEIYRGKEGINTVLKMILRDKKPYYIFGGGEEACIKVGLINKIFVKRAEKEKIYGKLLERKKAKFFVGKNEEYRIISDKFLSSTSTMLWNNKTAIFIWSEPYYVILIENLEVTRSYLSNFNYLWKIAKKPSKIDRIKRLLK